MWTTWFKTHSSPLPLHFRVLNSKTIGVFGKYAEAGPMKTGKRLKKIIISPVRPMYDGDDDFFGLCIWIHTLICGPTVQN